MPWKKDANGNDYWVDDDAPAGGGPKYGTAQDPNTKAWWLTENGVPVSIISTAPSQPLVTFSQDDAGNFGYFVEENGTMRMVKQITDAPELNAKGYFWDSTAGKYTYQPAKAQQQVSTPTTPLPWQDPNTGTVYGRKSDGSIDYSNVISKPQADGAKTQIVPTGGGGWQLVNTQTGAIIASQAGTPSASSSGGGGSSSGGGGGGNYSSTSTSFSTSDIGPVQDKLQRDKMAEDYKIFLMQHGLAASEAARKANEFALNLAFNKEEAIRRSELDLGKLGLSELEINNQRDRWESELGLNYDRLGFEYEQLGVQDNLQRDKMGLDYTTFLMQHGLARDEATRKGNEFSQTLSFNKEEAARRQMLDLAKLGLTEVELANQRAKWEGELGLGFGRLGLDTELGRGRLGFDYADLALERELGLGRLGLEGELGRGRLGLDTELGRARIAAEANQLALERELGKGKLSLGQAEVSQRAQASAGQLAAEAARLGLDTELGRGRLGLDTDRLGLDRNRLGLDAAQAFVQAISSANPLAATAMWQAGGGNLMNAYRTGATAITPEMLAVASEILATGRANTSVAQPAAPQSVSSQSFAPGQSASAQPFADRAYIPAPDGSDTTWTPAMPDGMGSGGAAPPGSGTPWMPGSGTPWVPWTPGTGMPGAGWNAGGGGGGGGGSIMDRTQAAIQAALTSNPNAPGGAASSSWEVPPSPATGTPYSPSWSRPPTGGGTGSGGSIAARTRAAAIAALAANAAAGTSSSTSSPSAGGTPGGPPNATQPQAPPPYEYATPGMGPDTNQGAARHRSMPPQPPAWYTGGGVRNMNLTPAQQSEWDAYEQTRSAWGDPRNAPPNPLGERPSDEWLAQFDQPVTGQYTPPMATVSPKPTLVMARGGMTTEPVFISGDSPQSNMFEGRPNPEMVFNPTGAPMSVVPLRNEDHAARVLALIRQRLTARRQMQQPPRFAWGTAWGGTNTAQPVPLSQEQQPGSIWSRTQGIPASQEAAPSGTTWTGNTDASSAGTPVSGGSNWEAPTPAYPQTNVGIPGRGSLAAAPPVVPQIPPTIGSRPALPPNPPPTVYPSIPLTAGNRGMGTTSGRGTEPTTGGPLPPEVPQTGAGSPMYDPILAAIIANEARRNIPAPNNPPVMGVPMPAPVASPPVWTPPVTAQPFADRAYIPAPWTQPTSAVPNPPASAVPSPVTFWTQPASVTPPIVQSALPSVPTWTQPSGVATGPVTSYPGQPTYNPIQNDPQSLFDFRQGSYVPNINRLALYRGPQYIRDVYAQGWQNRTGAPAQGWLDELFRFRPRGLSRSGITLGI